MFITPSFKKSLIVEQFQGNYLNEKRGLRLILKVFLQKWRHMQSLDKEFVYWSFCEKKGIEDLQTADVDCRPATFRPKLRSS